jgi:anti-anti-sigma factor
METWTKRIKDLYIIEISGRVDNLSSKDLEAKLDDVIKKNNNKIIIDLAAVEYISSVGLRVLLVALKKQKERDGSIQLVSLQPFVRDIFKITGFDRIFSISSSQEDAVSNYIHEFKGIDKQLSQ